MMYHGGEYAKDDDLYDSEEEGTFVKFVLLSHLTSCLRDRVPDGLMSKARFYTPVLSMILA